MGEEKNIPLLTTKPPLTLKPANENRPMARKIEFARESVGVAFLGGGKLALEDLTLLQMCLLTSPILGLSFCWRCLATMGIPHFMHLGISQSWSQAILFMGPVCGLFLFPIVGSLSDSCTSRFGRRRPFIAIGACVAIGALLLLGLSAKLPQKLGVPLAVVSYALASISLNVLAAPIRPQCSDLASYNQQESIQAFAAFIGSLGSVGGSVLAFLEGDPSAQTARIAFITCAFVLFVTVSLNVVFVEDMSTKGAAMAERTSFQPLAVVRRVGSSVMKLKQQVRALCLVQILGWMSLFAMLVNTPRYLGRKSRDDPWNAGFHELSLGIVFASVLSAVCCAALPRLTDAVGMARFYAFSFSLLSISCVLIVTINERNWTIFATTISGVAMATTDVYPYSIAGRHLWKSSSVGLSMGMLQSVLYLAMLADMVQWQLLNSKTGLVVGACWGALAAVAALTIVKPPPVNPVRDEIMV